MNLFEIEKQTLVDIVSERTAAIVHPLRFDLSKEKIEMEFKIEDRSGIYPDNHIFIKEDGSVTANFCEKWKAKEAEVHYFLVEEVTYNNQ